MAEKKKKKKVAAEEVIQVKNKMDDGFIPDSVLVLPVLPLRGTVVFPQVVMPLAAAQPRSLRLIDEAMSGDRRVVLVMQLDADVEGAGKDEIHEYGTVATILQMMRVPDGSVRLMVQGEERVRIKKWISEEPFLVAEVVVSPVNEADSVETQALARHLLEQFQRLVGLVSHLPDELVTSAINIDDPKHLTHFIATNLRLDPEERQRLLELDSVEEKLQALSTFMVKELDVLELGKRLQSEVQEELSKSQREFYLREQMKAIRRELGDDSDSETEIAELREKIEAASMPEEAEKEALRELERLAKLPTAAAEYGVIKTYLDWLIALPWDISTEGEIDISLARHVLNEDHYDLEQIKDRILEYLAVRKLKRQIEFDADSDETDEARQRKIHREPILCFVGPPGVGKTSLAQSIAKALGREMTRMSLGGVRDEAEIRGHRRTYVGAMPGRIMQAVRRAGANDPVFVLDEVDKVGADWRGDPSSALLEVLDPEQNFAFRDHYLDVPFDLSKVMFIATANLLDPIPAALRDRMEILELAGYTDEEKLNIARKFLVPKQMVANGLDADDYVISDDSLVQVISAYTREAGVRNLEREIGTICRKIATRVAEGKEVGSVVTPDVVREFLGRPKYFHEELAERTSRPGVSIGVGVTGVGGDIMFIEASKMPGKGGLTVTGQLGDVMRESAQAALSFVRSRAGDLGIDPDFLQSTDIHLHVPAGAIPKDGPSAGVAMTVALISLLTDRPVDHSVAMTGEITLRGQVLPVGGIKEKALAARRAGVKTFIIPSRNEAYLDDLPDELKQDLTFVLADQMDDVLAAAFPKEAAAKPKRKRAQAPMVVPAVSEPVGAGQSKI